MLPIHDLNTRKLTLDSYLNLPPMPISKRSVIQRMPFQVDIKVTAFSIIEPAVMENFAIELEAAQKLTQVQNLIRDTRRKDMFGISDDCGRILQNTKSVLKSLIKPRDQGVISLAGLAVSMGSVYHLNLRSTQTKLLTWTWVCRAVLQTQSFYTEKHGPIDYELVTAVESFIRQIRADRERYRVQYGFAVDHLEDISPACISVAYQVVDAHNLISSAGFDQIPVEYDKDLFMEFLQMLAPRYKLAGTIASPTSNSILTEA